MGFAAPADYDQKRKEGAEQKSQKEAANIPPQITDLHCVSLAYTPAIKHTQHG